MSQPLDVDDALPTGEAPTEEGGGGGKCGQAVDLDVRNGFRRGSAASGFNVEIGQSL
jgi:hypothetical protein